MKTSVAVVIPNWNGKESLGPCIDSLLAQTCEAEIIVVENGSTDGSLELLAKKYPEVIVLAQPMNLGFAGGVNVGLRYAMEKGFDYAALFNNDAVADSSWLKYLVEELNSNPSSGIATCKFLTLDKKKIDSTGDMYSTWGLPYPRGRDEKNSNKYDDSLDIFGATGGASLYRTDMLKEIGLFDEDFFAYYEDVDISFRAQLAGWKVRYVPKSEAYHSIGATSSKISGFSTYQTMKNLPWIFWKNVPFRIATPMFPRIFTAYWAIFFSSVLKGRAVPAIKGTVVCHLYMFKKLLIERPKIQSNKKVSDQYIASIITEDLPPNAEKLRFLARFFGKFHRGSKQND